LSDVAGDQDKRLAVQALPGIALLLAATCHTMGQWNTHLVGDVRSESEFAGAGAALVTGGLIMAVSAYRAVGSAFADRVVLRLRRRAAFVRATAG
jgi:hypothetical protein